MTLKLIICLLLFLVAISFAQIPQTSLTPADVVSQNKIAEPQVLDLSHTNSAVFDSAAFTQQNISGGRLNQSERVVFQNESSGVPSSAMSFLSAEPEVPSRIGPTE
jgi:hypothetical protein